MANTYRFTPKEVADALKKSFGIKTVAAQLLGCDDETIGRYCKRYPMVDKACKEARPRIVDIAEHNLIRDLTVKENCPKCHELLICSNCNTQIQFGKDWATRFVLMTLGKDRGYTERTELSGPGGGAIEVAQLDNALAEIQTIIIESLRDYPQAKAVLVNALKERKRLGNGNGE